MFISSFCLSVCLSWCYYIIRYKLHTCPVPLVNHHSLRTGLGGLGYPWGSSCDFSSLKDWESGRGWRLGGECSLSDSRSARQGPHLGWLAGAEGHCSSILGLEQLGVLQSLESFWGELFHTFQKIVVLTRVLRQIMGVGVGGAIRGKRVCSMTGRFWSSVTVGRAWGVSFLKGEKNLGFGVERT